MTSRTGGSIVAPLLQLTTSTTCTQNYLFDGSFEQTNLQAWPQMDVPGAVTVSHATGGGGHEGAGYLVTSTVASGGSVQQLLNFATSAGDYYQGTVWVRADAPVPAPVTGSVKLTASGLPNPVETESTTFSIGNTWTPVTVPLRLVNGHSQIAMTLVMTSANVAYDWDAANLYYAGLLNGSFDNGNGDGWQGYGTINTSVYDVPQLAFDGAWLEEFNTATAGNGIFQNVSLSPSPGQSYEASLWLRSKDGTPMSGTLALWGLGGTQEVGATAFTVDGNWTLVQAPLDVQNSGHTQLSAAIYLTTTTGNLDVDGATLVNNCLTDASMEYTDTTHWLWDYVPTGATVNTAYYTSNDTPEDGAGIQELNTSIAGASLGQDFQQGPGQNSSWQCGFWIRSRDGTLLNGRVDAVGLGGTTEFGSATSSAVGGSWTWVSSPLDVVQSNHTGVRCQMYMDTANKNYDIDAASLGPEDIGTFAPPAPTTVSASSAGNTGNASVSWSAPTGDIGWSSSASPLPAPVLDYQVTPYINGAAQASAAQTVTGTSASFSNLTSGPYTFAVAAGNVYGTGVPAASSSVTTIAAPGAPTGVSASPGNGQATVSWSAPSATNGAPLTGYAITPSLGSTTLQTMVVGTSTSFTVPNLANGQSYTFAVAATNNAGTGSAATSNAVVPGLPGAPSGVAASVGNGQATVSWTAPGSTGATAITGYVITPYISGTAQPSTTVWGTGTSGVVSGLTNGTAYTFAVAAMNAFGTGTAASSGGGTPAATVPSAPQAIAATAGNAQATVSWSAPVTNGGSAITGYTITPYLNGTPQTPTAVTASPATVTGLTNGSAYTFTVAATNAVGTGAASAASWTVYPASAPVNPSVTMTLDKGANGVYPRGGAATYTATISTNTSTAATVNFTDVLPGGISAQGAAIHVNGLACAAPVTCTATATTVAVNNLVVPVNANATVTVSVVVTALDRQCAALTDSAQITIQGGNSAAGSVPLVACDTGLGQAPWWSYVSQALGAQGTAQVNAANGNLVISQLDGIPMQLHGSLTFALRRTYNSQNDGSPLPASPFGAGWSYSFVDVGSDTALTALAPAPFEGLNTPAPVIGVDGSGARYVFAASGLSTVIDVDGLASTSPLATLKPVSLQKGTGYTRTCTDDVFTPPAGVHVSLLRYMETTTGSCSALSASTSAVLGYVVIGADRVRREFASNGNLLSIRDAAGNEVDFTYTTGKLTGVTEPGSGRAFTISYPSGTETDVADPAGETTKYFLSTSGNLTSVSNPNSSTLTYAYSGTGCNNAATQICSATDALGHATQFTYTASSLGLPRVASIQDRNGNLTTLDFSSPTAVNADRSDAHGQQLHERTRYAAIDSAGRVGEIDQGTTGNVWLHQTIYGWDTSALGCRQPDPGVDNDLCSIVRRALGGSADRVTDYAYDDEGRYLSQNGLDWPANLSTTSGFEALYFEATGSVARYTDSVAGSNTVQSTGQSGGRWDANTVFRAVTQTQSLSPRGNAAGSGFAAYLTTYQVDDNNTVTLNTVAGRTTLCATPGTPVANTGLVCEADQPKFDGTTTTATRYTYDGKGQRATMTTPKAIAENISGSCNGLTNQTPACYTFTYYANTGKDLSGSVSAGGWLKGVTDPTGNFVAYAYDAEGHQARTWDRLATAGATLSSTAWSSMSPPSATFTETLYAAGADTVTSTFARPWRFALAQRGAVTTSLEWTTFAVNGNGDVTGRRTARGTGGSPTSTPQCPQPSSGQAYDTCATFDNNDNMTSLLTPMEANTANYGSQKPITYAYDAFDNRTATTDATGAVTVDQFDAVNRATTHVWTRGAWPSDGSQPASCRQSTANDAPIPSGRILCSGATGYDGVDNVTSTADGNGHTSLSLFDAAHRKTHTIAPRSDAAFTNLVTVSLYDADGNVTDTCSPRELSEGGADNYVCGSTATYGTHNVFNPLDKVTSTTTYRSHGSAQTTSYAFDADGNQTLVTDANGHQTSTVFSVLDRRTSMSVPRAQGVANATTYTYDPAGHTTSVQAPAGRITDYSYNADGRVLDTVLGASNAAIASTTTYNLSTGTDVRTRNVYDADGNVIAAYSPNAFQNSGSVTTPDPVFMRATAFNADDEPIADYQPRYDNTADSGSYSDALSSQTPVQSTECPTASAAEQQLGYLATTGVCVTSYAYDPAGHRTQIRYPTSNGSDNRFATYVYSDDGLLGSQTGPDPSTPGGRVTSATYLYDADAKQTKQTDANGISTQTTYTADELVQSTTNTPNGSTTHQWQYRYNANGQQTVTIDAVGNLSSTAYYADGLVQSKTDGAGDVTSYGYDAVGNATTVTSPNANAAGNSSPANTPTYNFYTWDNLLMESEVPVSSADGVKQRSTCYYFDAAGRKTGEGDVPYTGSLPHTTGQCPASPPAQSLAFTYFPADRLDVETGRDGTSARDFAYDAVGNQVAAVGNTPSIWVSPTYYADGLLRTVNDGEGRTQSYAWDGAGQMTGRNSASSATAFLTTMTYTDAELPASENGFIAPGTPSTWTYDAGGRPLHETDNGTVISYVYALDGSVSQMGQTWSPHINFVDGDYRVTEDGCLTCQDAPSNGVGYVWNYQYDAAGRMTAMQSVGTGGPWQYARYDPSGNRLSHTDALSGATTTYTYNLDDTIATSTLVGTAAFADAYTTQGLLSTDGCIAYTPDAFDRTQAVAGQSGAPQACGTAPATTTYSYDALDRQVQTVSGSTTTTIHDDGLSSRELVESTGVGVDTGYQLTAAGTVLGVDRTSPSTLEFLSSDTKGSVSTSMSPSGAPGCQIQYDPFGQVVSGNSNVCETDSGGHQPATSSDVLYRNLHRDSTTGTYQMGARTYDPSKNTFLEPDHYQLGQPIQDVGLATDPLTRNARVYVDGDPVNHIDPTGHSYTTDDGTDNQGPCDTCMNYPTSGTCTACGNTTGTEGWGSGGSGSGGGGGSGDAGSSASGSSDSTTHQVSLWISTVLAQNALAQACDAGRQAACHGMADATAGYDRDLANLNALIQELQLERAAAAAQRPGFGLAADEAAQQSCNVPGPVICSGLGIGCMQWSSGPVTCPDTTGHYTETMDQYLPHLNIDLSGLALNVALFAVDAVDQEIPGLDVASDVLTGERLTTAAADATSSTVRVLGSRGLYTDVASAIGGKAFNIPGAIWEGMSPEEQWAANKLFLDRGILNGDSFLVVTGGAKWGRGLTSEINYLLKNGYDWTSNGLGLVSTG